jgi:hypothetical protein
MQARSSKAIFQFSLYFSLFAGNMGGSLVRAALGAQPPTRFKDGLEKVEKCINTFIAVGTLNYERSRYVANLVLTKKAVAIGIPNGASEPKIVPAFLFETDAFIKWSKNEVRGNDPLPGTDLPRSRSLCRGTFERDTTAESRYSEVDCADGRSLPRH